MKRQILDKSCKGKEGGPDSICFYFQGLCEDRMIDFDIFLDLAERKSWKELFEFRRDILHLSPEIANSWTIGSIKRKYQMSYYTIDDPKIPVIAPEHTISANPLTSREKEEWEESIAFRRKCLGVSLEHAIKWTRRNIEMRRQLSAQARLLD